MSDVDQLADLLADRWRTSQEGLAGNAEDYRRLLKALDAKVVTLGRTVARNRFNALADSNEITLVTNHDNTADGVVIMRGSVLAELIGGAVEILVRKAIRRRPLVARLEGLTPLPAGDDTFRVRYGTGHTHHRLHLRDESPAEPAETPAAAPTRAVSR
jgi:hypothetical protein